MAKTKYRGNGSPFVGMPAGLRDLLRQGRDIVADTLATKDAKRLAQPVQRPDRAPRGETVAIPKPAREV